MFPWTQQRLEWLEAAIEYTGYYDKIASYILPRLSPADVLCEIGCGLAALSLALAPAVKEITAVDISPLAAARAETYIRKRRVSNIQVRAMDWTALPDDRAYDAVVFSYFGAVQKDWEKLRRICRKYVVAVLPAGENSWGFSLRLPDAERAAPKGRETVPSVQAFLDERGVSYSLTEQTLDFGQPFQSRADACDFLDHYYEAGGADEKQAYLDAHLTERDGVLYLPKQKKSGVFIIDMTA
jgi:SAM-dependent methyltransferase